ncbi:hypothetical protein MMC32_007746 [Xylographa parallela]|nr:hypothetical protein [Xylographa parallela]
MFSLILSFIFAGCATAALPGLRYRNANYTGMATFNDYSAQSGTVCGPLKGKTGTYGGAAGDISPDISGGLCFANLDMTNCQNEAPVASYEAPACPTTNCGLCYRVTNLGGYGGSPMGGTGNSVIVQIIDSCPSVSAWNYCKTEVPSNQRCGNPKTNSMDIDQSAYGALTGVDFDWGVPNLNIGITPVACP